MQEVDVGVLAGQSCVQSFLDLILEDGMDVEAKNCMYSKRLPGREEREIMPNIICSNVGKLLDLKSKPCVVAFHGSGSIADVLTSKVAI
jgi:hypothetical protein